MAALDEFLRAFFETIAEEPSIGSSHISLYLALMYHVGFRAERVCFFREEVLAHARISRRTFNKCMNDLQRCGFIRYEPSKDARVKSVVYFKRL